MFIKFLCRFQATVHFDTFLWIENLGRLVINLSKGYETPARLKPCGCDCLSQAGLRLPDGVCLVGGGVGDHCHLTAIRGDGEEFHAAGAHGIEDDVLTVR